MPASVTMKGWILKVSITRPCRKPNEAPSRRARAITAAGFTPWRSSRLAESMVVSAIIEPTERSIPPERMTNVIPMAVMTRKRVVDEEVQEHLEREEAVEEHRPRAEHQHEQGEGDRQRQQTRIHPQAGASGHRQPWRRVPARARGRGRRR